MRTATRWTQLLSQASSSERREKKRKMRRKRRSIKAASRRIREDEEEREAKKKKDDIEEDKEVVSSAPSSPLHEPYLPDANSNPPLELIEAFKLAKLRYEEKQTRHADMITLQFFRPSCMFMDPQLFPVSEPATKAVLFAARFLLALSSTLDGKPLTHCSGFWIDWDEESRTGIVLTTAHLIRLKTEKHEYAPKAEVTVHLQDGSTTDVHLIYYQEHYDLAFFRARVDQPVQLPSFNDEVKCAQLVFRLGRDENFNLRITHRRPGYMNPIMYERPHHMYFQDEVSNIKYDDGGPIIDLDAMVVGMVNNYKRGSFIPSFILLKCLDLWKKFNFIPRLHLGLAFSGIRLLDPVDVKKIWRMYKIDDGLIVDEVSKGSHAEEVGIRRGDIIEYFNVECISTTVQLENLLLSMCKSTGNGLDAKVHLSVGVFHTRKLYRRTREFTAGVSDHREFIERGYYPVTLGEGTSAASVST